MEFTNLGSHCSYTACHQQDFLPFHCEGCNKQFCVDHRLQKQHSCPKILLGNQVFTCPICFNGVEIIQNQDWNDIFESHVATGQCIPKLNQKCPVRSCKTVLTHINSLVCNTCKMKTCLKHRYPDSHNCSMALCSIKSIKVR